MAEQQDKAVRDSTMPAVIEITDADYRTMFLPCDALLEPQEEQGRAQGPAFEELSPGHRPGL